MTPRAWLTTTWGRIRERLCPDLAILRAELQQARAERDDAIARIIGYREMAAQAYRRTTDADERLAQRTRELKAARAKLRETKAARSKAAR
jgi:exonuclease VII large subunit